MRRTGIFVTCVFGLLAVAATAQQSKPNFSGKWQLNAEKSQIHAGKTSAVTLGIEQKDASIHVVKTMKAADGKESVTEFTCTTDGKDCTAKGVRISLWYDGASLVEMDVSDDVVAKTSMTLGDGAKTLSLTITYIAPQAEGDKLVLEKIGI
ncbi:MAG: hypothetical protein ABUS51_01465 [Acidobacteriota bacterium]